MEKVNVADFGDNVMRLFDEFVKSGLDFNLTRLACVVQSYRVYGKHFLELTNEEKNEIVCDLLDAVNLDGCSEVIAALVENKKV